MKLINELESKPTVLLVAMIVIVSICIVVVVIILLYRLHNEKKVTRAALELKRITNSVRAGLVHFTLEDNYRILYASNGFYELLAYDKNDAKAENKISLIDFLDSRDVPLFQNIKKQIVDDAIRCELRMMTKDGNSLYVLMSGNCEISKDSKHTLSVVLVDISEQKKMQQLILLEGERYRIAMELSKDVLFEYHIKSDEMVFSDKFKDLIGRSPIIHQYRRSCEKRRDMIHPDDWGIYLELCQELSEGKNYIEVEFRLKDRLGEFIWCQLMGKTIYDDANRPLRVIGKLVNVDTQKRELEALEYKATRDPLTGVYNKEVTIKKIDKFITGNKDGMHMLMIIDIDDFKSINDTYGHLLGDKVLNYVIGRIKDIFTEGEIIGRIGGDEFVIFAGNIPDTSEVLEKAQALKNALDSTYLNDKQAIPIAGSIGIAIYPEAGLHYEQLIDRADSALYKVKEHGKNNFMLYH